MSEADLRRMPIQTRSESQTSKDHRKDKLDIETTVFWSVITDEFKVHSGFCRIQLELKDSVDQRKVSDECPQRIPRCRACQ